MYFKPLTLCVVMFVILIGMEHVASSFGYLGTGKYQKRTKPTFPNKRCSNGYYGIWCNQECVLSHHCTRCQHCVKVTCQHGSCIRSCVSGRWGPHCNKECFKDTHCRGCPNCGSVRCSEGTCARTCKTNWWGPHCNKECLQDSHCGGCDHCASSHCIDGHCTRKCNSNWWGPTCDKLCSDGCLHGACSDGDGECEYGCREGRFGPYCTEECSNNCASRRCSEKGGRCTIGCREGYFGSRCNQRCTEVASNCRMCLQDEGRCIFCQDGWHGPDCLQTCSEGCLESRCDMNGTCKCREGYFGTGCEESSKPYTKFWESGVMKAVTKFTITKSGCTVDGKLTGRNTVFTESCIAYKCGRNRVTVSKRKSGCVGGGTCLRGKMTTGGARIHCKVGSRTNRTSREITVNRKLTINEKVVTSYNITSNGCIVNGHLRPLSTEFTLPQTGPCVTFICKKRSVYIAKSKSGCSDGATCRKGLFTSGCNAIRCNMRIRSNRKLKKIALTVTMIVKNKEIYTQCHK